MRVLVVWVVTGCLLAGCGDEIAPSAAEPEAVPTLSATATPPTSGPLPVSTHTALFRRAVALLESVGVTGVAQFEPPHGSPAEALYGEWRGHEVRVGVVPTAKATFTDEVVRAYTVRDRGVRVIESPPYLVHQVNLGRDLWSVVVRDDEALTQALIEALVATQLPPEETPAEMVAHADNLYGVRVERTGVQLTWTSVWGIFCDHYSCGPSVLVRQTADDKSYELGTWADLQKALWTAEGQPDNPFGEGYLAQRVVSLRPGVEALIGGADGATELPFQLVSRNGGRPERVREPDRTQTAGAVVLADGRLLALLTDKPNVHSLWISDGDDWTTYRPVPTPDGVEGVLQALGASAEPDPVIWLETQGGRVFVSTDDATTFRDLAVR